MSHSPVLFEAEPGNRDDRQSLERAERILARAEDVIRLIERLLPKNLGGERARLQSALEQGTRAIPAFEYAPTSELDGVRRGLEALSVGLESLQPLGPLYADRARELELEAQLVLATNTPRFVELARSRYLHWETDGKVERTVDRWLSETATTETPGQVRVDDPADSRSLLRLLQAEIGALRLPVRVEVRRGLATIAAAGDGLVAIRADARLSAEAARRIAHHELHGHVLPRLAARNEQLGLFRVGSRDSADEEEGRAVLLEQRAGLLSAERRRELALRHAAAALALEGAELEAIVSFLRQQGVELGLALDLALRAARGGGLGREIVYIPAYIKLSAAFSRTPEWEQFFHRGRVSLAAARVIARFERSRT